MAWGGYPQLLGLGIIPLFILALDHFLRAKSLASAFLPALMLLGALATNDLTGPLTALIGALYLAARYTILVIEGTANSFRNVLLGIGLSIVLILPMAPIYVGLVAGVASNERAKLAAHPSPLNAIVTFNTVSQDFPTFWFVALIVALLAPLVLFATRDSRLALLSPAVLVPSLALLATVGENRLGYLAPLGIVAGLGAWSGIVDRLPPWSLRSLNAAVIACLVLDVLIGTQYYAEQRNYYTVLNPGLVNGLARLTAVSEPQQVAAVSPGANDWELGWWVEGVAHRPSIYAGNPIWLNYADEKARNAVANRIFSTGNRLEDSRREARDDGAAFLFVDKEWSGYFTWSGTRIQADSSIVYENESVLIVATGG